MRTLWLSLILTGLAIAQAMFTPGSPATTAVPAKLVANSPDGSIKCTLTGDTFPAKNITFACSLQGVTIQPFSLPLTTFTAFTFQFNQGTSASTVILSLTPGTAGTALQATVNAGTPVTGTF